MKYKYIIALFVVGLVLLLTSAALKILHSPGSESWLKASFAVIISSGVLLAIKLLGSKEVALNK